jgi:PhnB protein
VAAAKRIRFRKNRFQRFAGDKKFKTNCRGSGSIESMQIISLKPRLIVRDPDESIEFYRAALGAVLEERYVVDGRVVHAAVSIGGCPLSIAAEVTEWGLLSPTTLGGSAVLVTLEVDDARAVADRMVSHGADVLVPVEDRPYGRCEGRIQDPFGHLWIPTHEVPPDSAQEGGSLDLQAVGVGRIVADLTVADTAVSVDFYARLFDLDVAMNFGWVATLTPSGHRNRQLTLMTADVTAPVNPCVSIEVDDLDLVWRRAHELGAGIVHDRTIEAWGVERFFMRDPDGNVINVLSHAETGM